MEIKTFSFVKLYHDSLLVIPHMTRIVAKTALKITITSSRDSLIGLSTILHAFGENTVVFCSKTSMIFITEN